MTEPSKNKRNGPNAAYTIGAVLLLACGFAAVYFLSNFLERNRTVVPDAYADSNLDLEGKRLKGFALGFEGLLADWYWMRSLQYIGDKMIGRDVNVDDLRDLNPRLLYPYLDNATDLDPKFLAAYSYGAIVLPAIDPAQAIKLSEKAIVNNPDQWKLYHYLGYIHWRLNDFEKAADVYERGSNVPDAPAFMKLMVPLMRSEGGSRATAREMYTQLLAQSDDAQTKQTAEAKLVQINALDELDAINAALARSKGADRPCPNLASILPTLTQTKLPGGRTFSIDAANTLVDPTGVPYQIIAETCIAELGKQSEILRD